MKVAILVHAVSHPAQPHPSTLQKQKIPQGHNMTYYSEVNE